MTTTLELLSNATFSDDKRLPVILNTRGDITFYKLHYAEREPVFGEYSTSAKNREKYDGSIVYKFDENNRLLDEITIWPGKYGKTNHIAYTAFQCYVIQNNDTKKITLVYKGSMGIWDLTWKIFATQTN